MSDTTIDLADLSFSKPSFSSIAPACRCALLRHVPLDNSYRNTMTFATEAAQLAFFESKIAYDYTEIAPYRFGQPIRINREQEQILDCNYMIIKNSNWTQKNLFAFITKIEYVNTNVTNVYWEVDVFQTWFFNMQLHACFIERRHVKQDLIGQHIVDEGIPYGEYTMNSVGNGPDLGNKRIIVQYIPTDSEGGAMQSGVFSGLYTRSYGTGAAGVRNLNNFLVKLANDNKTDHLVNMYMGYSNFIPDSSANSIRVSYEVTKRITGSLDGYTPKNNKLYCYPYNFLYVENMQGAENVLRFEWFSTPTCQFYVYGTAGSDQELCLVPRNYNNIAINWSERLTMKGFPLCSWSSDSFRAWIAQQRVSMPRRLFNQMTSVGNAATSAIAGAATGNVGAAMSGAGAVTPMGAISSVGDIALGAYEAYNQPDKMHGNEGVSLLYASGNLQFKLYRKCINNNDAHTIDDYLSCFGYRVNHVAVPNITGRKSWNYVKTRGSCVTGDIPFNFLKVINDCFDRGITFWHGDYVGDYSRDNSIV